MITNRGSIEGRGQDPGERLKRARGLRRKEYSKPSASKNNDLDRARVRKVGPEHSQGHAPGKKFHSSLLTALSLEVSCGGRG